MREKILIDALEEIKSGKGRYNSDRFIHASNTIEDMKEIATKALSDYASQKEGLETPSQIFFKHLDKQRKKGDALLFKHIEPVIYAAMEEYAAQFSSSAPESGQNKWPKTKEQHEQDAKDYFMKHCNVESTIASASYRLGLFQRGYMAAISSAPESGGDENLRQIIYGQNQMIENLKEEYGKEAGAARVNFKEFQNKLAIYEQEIERLKGLIEKHIWNNLQKKTD